MTARRSARHHPVPASYIGGFSWFRTPGKRLRKRPVWVRSASAPRPFVSTAERRSYKENLYDLPTQSGWLDGHIDRWGYESQLPRVLADLGQTHTTMPAEHWLETLVPFVACQLVRGPDLNEGANNEGRFIQIQELLAPVITCRWTVGHTPPGEDLITNDRGLAAMQLNGSPGVVVPISPEAALLLRPGDEQIITRSAIGHWMAPVEHNWLTTGASAEIRRAIAFGALQEIYGPTPHSVSDLNGELADERRPPPIPVIAPGHVDLRGHFYDYYRVLARGEVKNNLPPTRPGGPICDLTSTRSSRSNWSRQNVPAVVSTRALNGS